MTHDPTDAASADPGSLAAFREIEDALARVRPDLSVVDHGLTLDDLVVELVAVDGAGGVVAILLADDDPIRTVVRAIDALRLDRARVLALEDHLRARAPHVDGARDLRALVLAGGPDDVLRARLAQLDPERVELLELCEVRSRRDTTTHWIATLPRDPEAGDGRAGTERFVAALGEDQQGRTTELAARLARLDTQVVPRALGGRLVWRFRGDDLVHLALRDGRLEAQVGGGEGRPLEDDRDLEAVVGAAIGAYVDVAEGRTGDEPGLAQVELIPRTTGVVLSREELEAFRD